MKINGLTALVTGANRGLGRAFVQALRDAGSSAAQTGPALFLIDFSKD